MTDTAAKPRARRITRARLRSTEATLLAVVVVGFAALAVTSGGDLLRGQAIQTVLTYVAVPVLIGLAQMVVLAVGQMNLSVGALGGFTAVLMGSMMGDAGWPAWLAVLAGIALATAIGAVNGLLVVFTRINGFVVTLATMTVLIGLQYRVVGTRTIANYSPGLKALGAASVAYVPVILLVAVVVAVAVAVFVRRSVPGRWLLASGGNPLAARLSGISNDRILVLAHTLSGLIIGIAAMVTVASAPGVNSSIGGDWLLPSFAAPIIGGVALTGGSVAVLGTVLAAFVVRLVDVARAQFSLDPSWVSLVVGVVVLGTVVLTQRRSRRG
ncbi:MAG: ABC-type transporter, integral rane subunit [Pseudonocardia sp.]|nr:ABC-type transporter, integral rane subunit [Pseudonocardia sp.]